MVLGFGLFVRLDPYSSNIEIILTQIVAGLGTGLSNLSPLLALQAHISSKDTAAASATMGFVRNLSAAISVVIGGVMFQNGMQAQGSRLKEELGASVAEQFSGKEAAANIMKLTDLTALQSIVVRAAYATSLRRMWILYTCTAATALLASAFLGKKVLSTVHEKPILGVQKENQPESTELR